jgi:integrase
MLKGWQLQAPPSEFDLLFGQSDGRPLRRSDISSRGMRPACRRAELRRIALKNLRHSFASGLLAGDPPAPITEVAHLMGHTNPGMTLRVYSHFIKDAPSGALARFGSGFLSGLRAGNPEQNRSGRKVDGIPAIGGKTI